MEEWLESCGRDYRTMIDEGLETVMTGQISRPAMGRRLRPGMCPGAAVIPCKTPRYTEEVPTVGVSLNCTNHLVDCANIHTPVNACGSNRENVRAAVEKITGKRPFRGTADDTVFCGYRDIRH